MKTSVFLLSVAASLLMTLNADAQEGKPWIHDPSTIMECDGKYYTFGTGGGGLISEDGWNWYPGAERPGGGAAPDALKIGDRYLIAYSSTGGGLGGGHSGTILTMWNRTLDPGSPDFAFTEAEPFAPANEAFPCQQLFICAGLHFEVSLYIQEGFIGRERTKLIAVASVYQMLLNFCDFCRVCKFHYDILVILR